MFVTNIIMTDSDIEHTDYIYEEDLLNIAELFQKKKRVQPNYTKYLLVGTIASIAGALIGFATFRYYKHKNKN